DLEVDRARLGIAMHVEGHKDQIIAVVAVDPLSRVPFINDKPFYVVNTLIGNHVLACALLPRCWSNRHHGTFAPPRFPEVGDIVTGQVRAVLFKCRPTIWNLVATSPALRVNRL